MFSRTTGPISIKVGTKHPCLKVIQVCLNEEPHLFPRGNNYKIMNKHWQNFKIIFSRTTGPISPKLVKKHFLVKVFKFVQMKKIQIWKSRLWVFLFLFNYMYNHTSMCLLIWTVLLIWTILSGERCGPGASW